MATLLLQPDALTLLDRIVLVTLVELSQSTIVYAYILTNRLERISLARNNIEVVVKWNYLMLRSLCIGLWHHH